MAERPDTTERIAVERERRSRLGVPVVAAGILYLLGSILVYRVFAGLHAVGLLQALQPALGGSAAATVSPRAAEIQYLAHHSTPLVVGGVLQGVAYAGLTVLLLFLLEAVRLRAPEPSPAARMLVLVGGGGTALVSVASEILRAVRTHEFVAGGRFGEQAVERAVSSGTANVIVGNLDLLLPIVLVVGMIMALLRATRVGLIPRWMRGLGILAAVMVLPLFAVQSVLQVIPAAWMVFMGALFLSRLPGGIPPAWSSGEAVPWPDTRPARGNARAAAPATALAAGDEASAAQTDVTAATAGGQEPDGDQVAGSNGRARGGRAASGGSRRSRRRGR
jgi:hypothetical protein